MTSEHVMDIKVKTGFGIVGIKASHI